MVDVRPAPVTTRQRFACFDGYRAIAATAIVVFHVSFIANVALRHPVAGQFLARLDVGVSLFFVISGFLLYRPFVAANLAGRPGPATLGFWRRRLLRIVPAYWAALVVIVYVLGLKRIVGVGDALVYFGFMQIYDNRHLAGGISQAWSLCTEMSFYLVLPLYAWLVRRKSGGIGREVRAVAAVYAAGLFVRALLAYGRLGGTGVYDCRLDWLPATMDLFALGMGLAVASAWQQQGGRAPGWLTWLGDRPWACWSGALAAYVVVATVVFDGGDLGQPFTPGQVMGREVLYGLVAVLLVVPGIFGSDERGAIRQLLRSRPLVLAGLVSYGIYLTHNAAIDAYVSHRHLVVFASGTPWPPLAAATAAGTAVGSVLLYRLVERPALALKARADPAGPA